MASGIYWNLLINRQSSWFSIRGKRERCELQRERGVRERGERGGELGGVLERDEKKNKRLKVAAKNRCTAGGGGQV